MKDYHVGIYTRLSRDDERQGESVSIENQKLMLRRYCAQQGWTVASEYTDDGWSGTSFDRPDFQRLLADVQQKKVNLVIVKDLSRLGRDYIEVGKYTDCVFPYYGCRFIALGDGVDTLRQNDDVAMIFKNVINDIYARDTSKKIRAVRRANAESGKFMGYKAPYGYQKSPEDKHRLIIDPAAAEVVRHIFALRKGGMSIQAVADDLNREHILPPREYALAAAGKSCASDRGWCRETVRSILGNEAYIGNLVQLRQGSLSYKDHRQRPKPCSSWARVDNTHQPIIDEATWQAVRELEEKDYHPRRQENGQPPLFAGLLYCSVCGQPLRRIVNRKQRSNEERTYTYYSCKGHVFISENTLYKVISAALHSQLAALDVDMLLETVKKQRCEKRRRAGSTELAAIEKCLSDLDRLTRRLYEDYAAGTVPQPIYQRMIEQYHQEMTAQETRKNDLLQKANQEFGREEVQRLLEGPLYRPLLSALIRRIDIAPKEKRGVSSQKIRVYYRYRDTVLL